MAGKFRQWVERDSVQCASVLSARCGECTEVSEDLETQDG